MRGAFGWHPRAVLIGAEGPVPTGPVFADRPGAAALRGALAVPGRAFRIGGGTKRPAEAALPMFETLTSGTSGQPRRIWRTQASWLASFAVNAGLFGIGPGVRVAVLGRLSQSLSLYAALEGLHLGAEVHLLDQMRPDRQRAALAARRIEVIYASPAQLRQLVAAAGPRPDAVRLVVIAGSKLDGALRVALHALLPGAALREVYGAAEASFITLSDSETPDGSVGRAYPGVRLQVRQGDRVLPDGERGVIWVQSPYLFQGYAGAAGPALWRDDWLSVGEIGWLAAGSLYLAGRLSRMVTIADQNVFPEEIEAFLAGLPGVAQVAVVPRADERRGQVLDAVMMGDPAQEAALLAAARARFGPLAAPRRLRWLKVWPLLPSGKTDLAALA